MTRRAPNTSAPAGRMIPIGRHRLHALDRGTAGDLPTVVFESGLVSPLQSWSWVQGDLAARTRTISYERAGTGWSEPGPAPRSVPRLAEELRALLTALEVTGPVVLVGHSFGGLVVRCFAGSHPQHVAGVVFADSLHAEELRRSSMQRRGMAWLEQSLKLSALQAFLRLGRRELDDQFTELPTADAAHARARLHLPGVYRAAAAELVAWKNADPAQVATEAFPPDVPVGVVVSGRSLRNDITHRKLQEELLTLSSDAFAATAADADHFELVLDRKQSTVVTEAVSRVLDRLADRHASAPAGSGIARTDAAGANVHEASTEGSNVAP
ncbi:alpha/beta fold hydrolase [Prauserella rugosa]|uniref:Pimeloyl-ACP methyl ester carboxylesterase n=1 Tax=Prauserella rugosa TaxID=43354 RepID=A0A660CFS0_9PSEU|nr:alpha/beta hydrolase [Prauserella rugosa]TWH20707.1 pimeloyl-ACP methyl ester carboxylesterase [Prauserella rugosa]